MKEMIIGIIGATLCVLTLFIAGSTFDLFSKEIRDTQIQSVARKIINDPDISNTLIDKMDESKKFKGEWPEGNYGIFACGNCPDGFRKETAFLNGITFHANTTTFIKASSLGSSHIDIHNAGRSGALGDIKLELQ